MAKTLIFVLSALCSTIIAAPLDGLATYELDGIEHTYSLDFEIGEMDHQVGPFPSSMYPSKQVNRYEWVGDRSYELNKNHSTNNYTIKTVMPFSQIDTIFFEWQDMSQIYGHVEDANIQTAYLTETTPNQPRITKKYCADDEYPKNLAGSLASRSLSLC
uniref:WIF domain-containing protein n=1 Tax=Tetranychus urticae TaxID=32264 RepID=T1KSR3_TETUR